MDITIKNPNIAFGYSSVLKTLYKKGKLPTVKYGFYGEKLTNKNCSLEHLIPHSKGGKTELDNLVLATKQNNSIRGNKSLIPFFDAKSAMKYLDQFIGVKRFGFDGNEYVLSVLKTLARIFEEGKWRK